MAGVAGAADEREPGPLPAADWIKWCKQAHGRPLPLRAVDELQTMELERMWPGKTYR